MSTYHQVTLFQLCQGRVLSNVVCVEDPANTTTQDNIAGAFLNFWIPVIKVVQWNQLTWSSIQVKQMLVGPSPPQHTMSINVVGTGGTSKLVAFNAWKLRWGTGLAGRKQRGRYFITAPSFGTLDSTTEQIGTGSIATFNTLIANLVTNWVGPGSSLGLKLCVAHKDGSTPTRVTAITYDNFLTHIRSRKFGVGT